MKTNTQPIESTIIEVAEVKTRQGLALIYKGWQEESCAVVNVWTDANKVSPFLKGKTEGDTMRLIAETRTTTDINGKKSSSQYFTPIPSV